MKTPEEIKQGLECCMVDECFGERENCPYKADPTLCVGVMCEDAMAYIRQLEAERDAAVKDIVHTCATCKHYFYNKEDDSNCEYDCMDGPEGCHNGNTRWEWRGVQKEEHHE